MDPLSLMILSDHVLSVQLSLLVVVLLIYAAAPLPVFGAFILVCGVTMAIFQGSGKVPMFITWLYRCLDSDISVVIAIMISTDLIFLFVLKICTEIIY